MKENNMLVLKAFINHKQIDEIHVQNIGEIDTEYDVWAYKIRKPKGHEGKRFFHVRSEGYLQLASNVLGYLSDKEFNKQVDE